MAAKRLSMRPVPTFLTAFLLMAALPVQFAGADFTDDDYHEYILNDSDTAHLDVLIVPPAAPGPALRLAAVERSIDAWEAGILELGAQWLVDGFTMDHYTLPYDTPPRAALEDAEIVVISGEANPFVLFGIGAGSDALACQWADDVADYLLRFVPGDAAVAPPELPEGWHQHPGSSWAVQTYSCEASTENVCVVLNTNFALDQDGQFRMYDLNAHEFGHCLGIGHVGDALDFEAKNFPEADIMSYQFDDTQVFCVSNLNVRSIEGVFAKVLGQPESAWLDGGDYYHMQASKYTQVDCANPPT